MQTIEDDRRAEPATLVIGDEELDVIVQCFEEGADLMTLRLVMESESAVEAELVISRQGLTSLWFVPQQR